MGQNKMIAGPLANNEPSIEFKALLKNIANQLVDLKESYEKLLKMGIHEGFTKKEVDDMVKTAIGEKKTRMQLRYLFDDTQWKEAAKKQYHENKKVVNINQNQNEESASPKIIDVPVTVESPNMRKLREHEQNKAEEKQVINEAAINAMMMLIDKGFDPDRGVQVIDGNINEIKFQLDAYRESTRKALVIFQKLE